MKVVWFYLVGFFIVGVLAISGWYVFVELPKQREAELALGQYELEKVKVQEKTSQELQKTGVYAECNESASNAASKLLKDKSELPGGGNFKAAAAKGMYLKDDYDQYYLTCLRKNGIIDPVLEGSINRSSP